LDAWANRLAHVLIATAPAPERVVALAVPRSVEMIVAELAVLKAGAAYLPLDQDYPAERIAFMVSDAGPVCVVTTPRAATARRRRRVAGRARTWYAVPATDPAAVIVPANAAYVIYTSGLYRAAQGRCGVPRRCREAGGDAVERSGSAAESGVAVRVGRVSTWLSGDLCLGLLSGGRLVVAPSELRFPGTGLVEYTRAHEVNFMILPPALLAEIPKTLDLPRDSVCWPAPNGVAGAGPSLGRGSADVQRLWSDRGQRRTRRWACVIRRVRLCRLGIPIRARGRMCWTRTCGQCRGCWWVSLYLAGSDWRGVTLVGRR